MHVKAWWISFRFLLRAVIYFSFHSWSFMLTPHLCAAALSWGDFHIRNFLLSKTVSLNKNSSLSVQHINMPEHGLAPACVVFLTAYPSSLKATTEKYCSLLIPNFQGSSLKKKKNTNQGLLWGFIDPSSLLRRSSLKQESHLAVS